MLHYHFEIYCDYQSYFDGLIVPFLQEKPTRSLSHILIGLVGILGSMVESIRALKHSIIYIYGSSVTDGMSPVTDISKKIQIMEWKSLV